MKPWRERLVRKKPILNDFGFNTIHQGIYCLFCEGDKTYVGQSTRIQTRYLEHENKRPKSCFVLEHIDNPHSVMYNRVVSSDKVLDTCEALWMAILEPDLNIQRPKLYMKSNGTVLGWCINPGRDYEKPSKQIMRYVASALNWSIEKQDEWIGERVSS